MAQLILDDSDDTCDLMANMAYKMSQEFPTAFLDITLVPLFSHLQYHSRSDRPVLCRFQLQSRLGVGVIYDFLMWILYGLSGGFINSLLTDVLI